MFIHSFSLHLSPIYLSQGLFLFVKMFCTELPRVFWLTLKCGFWMLNNFTLCCSVNYMHSPFSVTIWTLTWLWMWTFVQAGLCSFSLHLQAGVVWLSEYVYNWTRGELHISRPQHSSVQWSRARAAFHSLKITLRSNMHQSFRCSYWCGEL